jgi:hypothetical protein
MTKGFRASPGRDTDDFKRGYPPENPQADFSGKFSDATIFVLPTHKGLWSNAAPHPT